MKIGFVIAVLALAFIVWYPFITPEEAVALVGSAVTQEKNYTKCLLTPQVNTIKKAIFGYTEIVKYDCTVFDSESITKGQNVVFVSSLKTVTNIPHPVIR